MKDILEKKLNKEYKNIGSISIQELHEEVIDISKIKYVNDIMAKINPISNDEPVVVSRYRDEYKIIDGYHRIKNNIIKGNNTIKAFVLDEYKINRKSDTLFNFLEQLIGQSIKFITNNLIVIDKQYYEIKNNEGCGGCSNGWSSIEVLKEFINKKLKIKTISKINEKDDKYGLLINNKIIANVDTGWGNGYYGGDFEITLMI